MQICLFLFFCHMKLFFNYHFSQRMPSSKTENKLTKYGVPAVNCRLPGANCQGSRLLFAMPQGELKQISINEGFERKMFTQSTGVYTYYSKPLYLKQFEAILACRDSLLYHRYQLQRKIVHTHFSTNRSRATNERTKWSCSPTRNVKQARMQRVSNHVERRMPHHFFICPIRL